MSRNTVIVYFG